MTRTIWKFPLSFNATTTLEMPEKAQIVYVDMQGDIPTLWAEVETMAKKETRYFMIRGTGHPIPISGKHVGSCQHRETFLWHIYEIDKADNGLVEWFKKQPQGT